MIDEDEETFDDEEEEFPLGEADAQAHYVENLSDDEYEEEELLLEEEEEELLIPEGHIGAFIETIIGSFVGTVIFHGEGEVKGSSTSYESAEIDGETYSKHDVVRIEKETGVFVIQCFMRNERRGSSWVEVYGGRPLYHSYRAFSPERIRCHVPNPPRVMFQWEFDEKPKKNITTKVR